MRLNVIIVLSCHMLIIACGQTEKEKFVEYKFYDSYMLLESNLLLDKSNARLVEEISICDSSAIYTQERVSKFMDMMEEHRNAMIEYTGGYHYDGSLIGGKNIEGAKDYFLTNGNGKKITTELYTLRSDFKKIGLTLNLRNKYYEQRWKEEFTLEEYLFLHETPDEIFEIINRIQLRVLIDLNGFLIKKSKECHQQKSIEHNRSYR